jgi:RNA polymerase sigma-70 factor (ECF subfamily)
MINFFKEKELLRNLSAGDQMAFGILYNTYYERLYYFSMHYINDEETVKDILQDVFSGVWEKKETFSERKELISMAFYDLQKQLS